MAAIAFLMLGFLIGNLVGMSAESLVATLMPLLFTFGGGSAIGLLHKVDEVSRKVAFTAIFTLSIGCLSGVYLGVAISEYQLLSPVSDRSKQRDADAITHSKYLRSYLTSEAEQIDQLYVSGALGPQRAYERLYGLITTVPEESEQ